MIADAAPWLLAVLLGMLLTLDETSVGQFMVSRPLVACTLAGALAGSAALGATLGAVLEALHLAVLPVGASRYPEAAPAAVATATVFVWVGGGYDALLPLIVFAVGWEQLGSWTVHRLRSWNGPRVAVGDEAITLAALERRHLGAIGADAVRGALLTAAGLAGAAGTVMMLDQAVVDPGIARVAAGVAGAAALGSSVRLFGRRRLPWFAAGAALAAATLWAQR